MPHLITKPDNIFTILAITDRSLTIELNTPLAPVIVRSLVFNNVKHGYYLDERPSKTFMISKMVSSTQPG